MRVKKIFAAVLPLVMLILEAVPSGAVLVFTVPTESGVFESVKMTYSYFDPTPFGYANFGPLFCAATTVCLAIFALLGLFVRSEKANRAAKIFSVLTLAFSLLPIAFGADYMSVVGVVVSVLSVAEIFLV